jgi:hypothetical protein
LPGFRDHCVYKGHQVFLYKRAQIFVADLWGAFKGQGLGEFKDIASITMFADYVVPAVLRHWGILTCSHALAKMMDSLQELAPGSEEEVELRACTITAVERLREYLTARTGQEVCNSKLCHNLDWLVESLPMTQVPVVSYCSDLFWCVLISLYLGMHQCYTSIYVNTWVPWPYFRSHGNCKVKLPKAGIMLTWVIFLGHDFQCTCGPPTRSGDLWVNWIFSTNCVGT